MIASMNDDQIFQATRDIEFTVLQKTQIAGAQEWTFAGI